MAIINKIPDFLLTDARYLIPALLLAIFAGFQWASYRRLSNFKGPFWAGWTNLWMLKSVYLRGQHMDLYNVSQRYGLRQ